MDFFLARSWPSEENSYLETPYAAPEYVATGECLFDCYTFQSVPNSELLSFFSVLINSGYDFLLYAEFDLMKNPALKCIVVQVNLS